MLDLPKSPKVADVAAALVAVEERITALEVLASSNRARLDAIDTTARTAGAEAAGVRAVLERERFLRTLRRR